MKRRERTRPARRWAWSGLVAVVVTAPIALIPGCTTLSTREDQYRERKVALDPGSPGGPARVAGVSPDEPF